MKTVEATAKTVEEAVQLGLKQLQVEIEHVEVEVLQQPTKGFLGIGAKPAVVSLSVKYDPIQVAENFLKSIFESIDIDMNIHSSLKSDELHIILEGKNVGIVIGKRGETLDALQYLTNIVLRKEHREEYIKVVLDVENYRSKREETLIQLSNKLANQVKKTGKKIVLEPMNAYERKIIHSALQNHSYVNTHSEGKEPYRKVVITLK